jgi:xanthine dehydrogenase accessory factor
MRLDHLAAVNADRAARRATILVLDYATGTERLIREAELDPADPLFEVARERFRSGESGPVETAGGRRFLTVSVPPPRLFLIGAVHISQALAPIARIAGYEPTVIDPRTAFATPERFPDVRLLAEWPQDALPAIGLDRYTAVASLTHDPKVDDPALIAALKADCFYVGALGSRKTHAKRLERLAAAGLSEAEIARIHAPIGLDLGGRSPPEIAVAVMAQIVRALRGGKEPGR